MANTVYDIEEVQLQDGTVVTLKPLPISSLRKFMKGFEDLGATKEESENLDVMVNLCKIALDKLSPGTFDTLEALEDVLDMPTIWKIIEVCGGIKMGDPNQPVTLGANGLI